jgi:subtilisin family serine protease
VGDLNIANLRAGGLVGSNTGLIQSSIALGNVQAGGRGTVGGLVASNQAMVASSSATGDVRGGALSLVGGLAGENFGTIMGPAVPNLTQLCAAGQACASGAVSVGVNGTAGGLAAVNRGTITSAFATGSVTGAAGAGAVTTLGGLVGSNQGEGQIATSSARGDVGGLNIANLQAGGLVGSNAGTILSSIALGNVQSGGGSTAGGFVASNTVGNPNCAGCPNETALIAGSSARGNVAVGAASVAGGFAGTTDGTILSSSAIGTVTGGGNSVLGGFVGTLGFGNGPGEVTDSSAAGAVTTTGPNSTAGGFVGLSGGTISSSASSGAITGTSESYLGGFVGVNLGTVEQSIANGSVTGVGARDVIGGFVGANFGSIDASAATGNAIGGTNSAVGAFAGANATFVNFPSESVPGSSFPVGTITNSFATGTASGGAGSTVDPFIALVDPTTAANPPAFPSTIAGCADPTCVFVVTGLLPSSATSPLTPPVPPPLVPATPSATFGPSTSPPLLFISPDLQTSLAAQQAQVILNLTANIQLAALVTPPVVSNVPGAIRTPPQPAPQPPSNAAGGARQVLPSLPSRIVDIPPATETRMIKDEVVVQIASNMTTNQLQAAIRRLGLTVIASESLTNSGSTVVRLKITDGKTPAAAIRSLANVGMAAIVQPNYVYNLDQAATDQAPAAQGDTGQQGDAAQYILEKLKMLDVHRMVRGANVTIAVIDSEIDATHPDLVGVVAQRFSAVGAPEKPHPHGTGMAGAMAARHRVLGTAPAARLLAVHAFSSNAAKAESTTFNILKGIDWAVGQGARVINMSFAGPKDPSLERALKLAYDRGIVLVAAAGNAGAKSPPLFPGADPFVIAVTATDIDDKLFPGANRGKYISVAAPGVDILVPAPESGYQLTTGTSVAAAEVSGIVALLLERNPKLTPADIRRILSASARRLAPGDRDDNFGSGLIDPLKALQLADPRIVSTPPAPTRQR